MCIRDRYGSFFLGRYGQSGQGERRPSAGGSQKAGDPHVHCGPDVYKRQGVGCYRDSVHMKAISDGLRRELEAIAAARGIDLRIAGRQCPLLPK